jgi:hypothetical protein
LLKLRANDCRKTAFVTHGAFMLPDSNSQGLKNLAKRYFIDELGLPPEAVSEASQNLIGAFEVLLKIDERIKKSHAPTTQPL